MQASRGRGLGEGKFKCRFISYVLYNGFMKKYLLNDYHSNDLSHHILPNSATMVGVCIMVISIVKSMTPGIANYLIDKAVAIDSILFMVSALLSFLSIRLDKSSVMLERLAEIIFLLGLVSMTLITVVFSFEIV
jgi:hypothetical protein